MQISIITIFHEMFNALNFGIPDRAQKKELLKINLINPRDFSDDKHRRVDDRPFGGGPGMVMMYEPLKRSILHAKSLTKENENALVIYLTPQGKKFDQNLAANLSQEQHLILLAGRYEGVDERLIDALVDEEISIGDYVLSGGEIPAMVLIDAITRLIPGALGDSESANQDSFSDNLLDYPTYTRPEEVDGHKVPEVLLSGNHKEIAKFRKAESLKRTLDRRPDLLQKKEQPDNE